MVLCAAVLVLWVEARRADALDDCELPKDPVRAISRMFAVDLDDP